MLATRVADVAIPDRGGAASHAPDVEVAGPAQGPHRRFDDPKEHALLVLGGSHPRCFDVGVGGEGVWGWNVADIFGGILGNLYAVYIDILQHLYKYIYKKR